MYRYLLFASQHYEEFGDMSDLVFEFNTVDELQKEMENGGEDIGLKYKDFFLIHDIKNDKIYRYFTVYGEDIHNIFDDFINENL
ncbi:hypothetical protein BT3_217 [Staphylococcus phage BT3]|uniref:Uncharacterized protein n=1 Tax=Staphylococcus phage PM22 TaxID=2813339 RepID=A0A8E5K8I5_9CAUD|nr:hypothetical protein PM9_210 [Staphylococcus phage PM9]QVD56450.1 hypothetical protein PM22_205 [Staphylococcus phage PM22]QVD56565.1 hypothetical protein PM25_108 [Staphylococcus phage PM25]QVD56685.1 hypothetical protein PM28_015 [Staphylococcus phage PM28]QVD57529.1 hypothetical protein PM32_215 [Staphylococcus phage PM32]QVD58178.1 hypothetical protein BT3_217 [Staphylococcus phage BT3]QVD58404.1 hypothetical protein PM4_211 [Staphylococcus phage PM4]UYE90418.1 hypothetical protein [S